MKKRMISLLCVIAVLAAAFSLTACQKADGTDAGLKDGAVIGKGAVSCTLEVVDPDGVKTTVTLKTDKEFLADALLENRIVRGTEGEYGLFIDTVNGITVDYDKDGKYWAFYVDGEYATSSASETPVTEGTVYTFKVE